MNLADLEMEPQSGISSEVVLTTETPTASLTRIFTFLFFSGISVGFAIFSLFALPPIDFIRLCGSAFIQLTFLSLALFTLMIRRGTWTIDSEGIRYQPCLGRLRSLAWSAVERVQWNRRFIVLRSGSDKILLDREQFSRDCWGLAVAAIETHLSSDFDLKPVVLERSAGWHRLAIVSAISSGLVLAVFAVVIFAIRTFPEAGGAISRIFSVLVLAMLFGLHIFCLFLAWARLRAVREKHPYWPWRIRRSKLKSTTSIDREFELV